MGNNLSGKMVYYNMVLCELTAANSYPERNFYN